MTEPHSLDIPACLLLTAEQPAADWKRQPPKPMPAFGRELSETERRCRVPDGSSNKWPLTLTIRHEQSTTSAWNFRSHIGAMDDG